MIIMIDRHATPVAMRRELLLSFGKVLVTTLTMSVEVSEFSSFLHCVYHSWAVLSRGSEGDVMRLPLRCVVNGRRFWVRVEGNAIRYGEE